MDSNFLEYYNRELAYLRELGEEFAEAFPKIGARLGMAGEQVADPYVERLLEGFAFLAARIHQKMDAEFPRFSQRLLEVVYPHYLAPTPSMAIVQLMLDVDESGKVASEVVRLPHGTCINSPSIPGSATRCKFLTAHDAEVWPIEVVELRAGPPSQGQAGVSACGVRIQGALRIRLRWLVDRHAGADAPERLTFHVASEDPVASQLFELVVAHGKAVLLGEGRAVRHSHSLPGSVISVEGFRADQALLPNDPRVFQGYRLLHEYFAFPQRFLFFTLEGLGEALREIDSNEVEISILCDQEVGELGQTVNRSSLALACVPVINLFPFVGNRLPITQGALEHHIVPDRARPLDLEVYRVDRVDGVDRGNDTLTSFAPFYSYVGQEPGGNEAYFSVRREPRRISDAATRNGGRSAYLGSEVFLSLVDTREAPWPESIDQLSVEMLLTNRDLPLLIPSGADVEFEVETSLPCHHARILRGPTRPRTSLAECEMTWRLISHLSLNYLALRDLDSASAASQLRELLGLYGALAHPVVARQAESITAATVRAVNRRLPVSGPLVFGRGVSVTLTIDERAFAGGSPYLFGSVLERFLARHVSMNMFCELSLVSTTRGTIASWPPRWGGRADA